MTRVEVVDMFAVISAAYPRENSFAQADKQMISVWASMLQDVPFETVKTALQAHVASSPFPPSISDIRGWMATIHSPEMDGAEAWGCVVKAIHDYGYYQEGAAKKALGEKVWCAVERTFSYWSNLCTSENIAADRAHFMKVWDSLKARRQSNYILPAAVNKLMLEAGNEACD